MRYQGQFSEIRVELTDEPITLETIRQLQQAFEREHELLYGHRAEADNPVEIVAVRLIGRVPPVIARATLSPAPARGEAGASRPAYFGPRHGLLETPVVARRDLAGRAHGPPLIDEYDSTIVVPPDMTVWRDDQWNLHLERADA
jgi:N-methylhydantoinase A